MQKKTIPAPPHLTAESTRLWVQVTSKFELDQADVMRLQSCCEAFDRMQQARRRLKKDGSFIKDRFKQLKTHPAVAVERDARVGFLRALRELGMDVADGDPGEFARPPRIQSLGGVT